MSGGLELIRERMTQYLQQRGVNAVTAWPQEERREFSAPAAVVSLRSCQAGPSGFQDYLGERFNEKTGIWEELYGRKVELTFGLDLYASARVGEQAVQSAFEALAGALQEGGPDGLQMREVSCGETVYDQSGRLLKRPVQAVCTAYLYAVKEPDGEFLDFEIRGGIRH